MKKFSRFAALLVLSASFVTPLLASAVVCGPNETVDLSNSTRCIPINNSPSNNAGINIPQSSGGINISVIQPYADSIKNIINHVLMPVFMAIAFIVFLWGIFKYFIWGAENDTEKAEGRKFAMWGIIGFVIILSVWGLVNIVTGALALPNNNAPNPPRL